MSKELVIASGRHETKVAVLEEDQLVEIYFQRANEYSLAGSIHKGKVTRVLPGMQSAFVDLGLERDTFLYVSDFFEEHPDIDTVAEEKPAKTPRFEPKRERTSERERTSSEMNRAAASAAEEPVKGFATVAQPTQAAAFTAAVPPPSSEETDERSGDPASRDRRARRSRRRTRGRGFPENKYAQPPTGDQETVETAEPEEQEAEDQQLGDVLVLPGESLAKYRNTAASAAAPRQQAEAEHSKPAEEKTATEPAEQPESALKMPEQLTEEQTPQPDVAPIESESAAAQAPEEFAQTESATEEGGNEDEEAEDDIEEEGSYNSSTIHLVSEPDEQDLSLIAEARAEVLAEIVQAQAESAINSAAVEEIELDLAPEPEEAETTLLILDADSEEAEELEVEFIGETSVESEMEEAVAEAIAAAAGAELVADQGAGDAAQSARVREQGGRYPHRVSRRMRRRRGGRPNNQGNPNQGSNGVEANNASTQTVTAPVSALPTPPPRSEARESEREEQREPKADRDRPLPSITDLLKAGQEIIVQIAKEPLGQKGARITSHIALPGRYVVYMPSVEHLGVSRKIASDEERLRLKKILQAHRVGTIGGFIVRTAGEGRSEEEIAADMNFLYNLWLDIRQKAEKKPAPALLHHDLDVVQRILRDQLTDDFKAVWVDSEEMYESILRFVQRFQPALVARIKLYTRKAPIFDAFNITQELEKALRPKVWLKSGGYIVINQTEALVAIDVNTGKFVGKSNRLEDTIVKTNTEAVKEIVRQVRLRDLGGIIVVDFIDMDERRNRQKVMQTLEEAMRADKAPYKILQFNDFGLVAITRKRVKQSLERTLCSPCPYCEGAGYVKSVQTVMSEILIEAQKIAAAIEGSDVVLRCNPEVARALKSKDNQYLEELEEILGRPVLVSGDVQIHLEKFDLA